MLLGLVLSTRAGKIRQASRPKEETTSAADIRSFGKGDIGVGLIVCILAGVLSSMVNIGLIFGDPIRLMAVHLGASRANAINAVWLPLMASCFLVNFAYCAYLLTKNRTWSLYLQPGTGSHWLIGFLMGGCQMGSLSLYGVAANMLGEMGAIMGFPVFLSMTVLTANTAGLLTGEWRGASRAAYRYGVAGMLALIISIVIIGLGNSRT
jgi:L-rhamnose-H+ transport protein